MTDAGQLGWRERAGSYVAMQERARGRARSRPPSLAPRARAAPTAQHAVAPPPAADTETTPHDDAAGSRRGGHPEVAHRSSIRTAPAAGARAARTPASPGSLRPRRREPPRRCRGRPPSVPRPAPPPARAPAPCQPGQLGPGIGGASPRPGLGHSRARSGDAALAAAHARVEPISARSSAAQGGSANAPAAAGRDLHPAAAPPPRRRRRSAFPCAARCPKGATSSTRSA